MRPAIIGAPTSLGAFAPGQEQAPQALREAGVAAGFDDFGDITLRRWRPDREHRRAQNAAAVAEAAREVAERVEAAFRAGRAPVVLGGDCTVGVGTVAGAQAAGERVGLVYFDLHPDLNTPETVVEGTLDWMGVAHMLGLASTPLAELATLAPGELLLFARQDDQTQPGEREAIERLGIESIMVEEVAADPRGTAERAARRFDRSDEPSAASTRARRLDRYLVHFDVDVVDFVDLPLSENTGHNIGLAFDTACAALDVLVAGDGFAGLTVTEHNPAHGAEDGSATAALAAALQRALKRAASMPSGAPQSSSEAGAGMP
jgi:arginase